MYTDYINFFFISFISIIYALIEIELEGKNGWMVNIPTAKVFNLGNKSMTLYHIYMIILVFGTIMFQNNMALTINSFLYSLSNFLIFLFLEDTLWFILNPYFTIKKFKKENIWWHSKQPWIFGQPLHNYIITISMLLIFYITNNTNIVFNLFLSYLILILSIFIAPIYHKFYKYIHA